MPFPTGGAGVLVRIQHLIAIAAMCLATQAARGAEDSRPHAPVEGAGCSDCHAGSIAAAPTDFESVGRVPPAQAFTRDGVAMCSGCHSASSSHVVGVPVSYVVPPDLPLGEGGVVTCVTCHYSHGSLDSERPRASFSFTDRLTDSPRLRKSFLLRRDNSSGELCRVCHNPANEGNDR